jgi:3-hydroxyacyl-CoA dehydrogenase
MGLFELADYTGIDTLYRASEAVRSRDASNVLVAHLFKEKFRLRNSAENLVKVSMFTNLGRRKGLAFRKKQEKA